MKKLLLRIAPLLFSLLIIINTAGCALGTDSTDSTVYQSVGDLTLRFLYVGQADSALITLPDGKNILVDAGDDKDGKLIAKYIASLGIDYLDFVVVTHPHADHLGGMDKVLDKFQAGAICFPAMPSSALPDTANYKDFVSAANAQQCGITYIKSGDLLFSDGEVEIRCLSPGENDVYSELNNYSIVLKITYGNEKILLMGDAEKESEAAMIADGADIDADLIKIGHHGSKTSSTANFINRVSPDYAIISCGIDNPNSYPNPGPLESLDAVSSQIYVTSECGTVIAVCDGNSFNISQHPEINLDGNADS